MCIKLYINTVDKCCCVSFMANYIQAMKTDLYIWTENHNEVFAGLVSWRRSNSTWRIATRLLIQSNSLCKTKINIWIENYSVS